MGSGASIASVTENEENMIDFATENGPLSSHHSEYSSNDLNSEMSDGDSLNLLGVINHSFVDQLFDNTSSIFQQYFPPDLLTSFSQAESSPGRSIIQSLGELLFATTDVNDRSDDIVTEQRLLALSVSVEWDVRLSHHSLDVNMYTSTVSRSADSESFYPTAFAQCNSMLCCVTTELIIAPRREGFFSFGLLVRDEFSCNTAPDLANCIGRVPQSWGIVDRRNNSESSTIYAQGLLVGHTRSLVEGDRLSLWLDVRNTEAGFNAGLCLLLLNNSVVHVFSGLSCATDLQYLFGAGLCKGYVLGLLEDVDVRGLISLSQSASDDDVSTVGDMNVTRTDSVHSQTEADEEVASPAVNNDNESDTINPAPRTVHIATTVGAIRPLSTPVPSFFPRNMSVLAPAPVVVTTVPSQIITAPVRAVVKKASTEMANIQDDSKLCCICLDRPKCVVLMPCKHLCVCASCGQMQLGVCPICREPVDFQIKVFM